MQGSITYERLERLKKAEPAIYFHTDTMFRESALSPREEDYVRRMMSLGKYQMKAKCSWYEYDLMRAPYEVEYLEGVVQEWDQIPPSKHPTLSREAATERLLALKRDVSRKEAVNADAKSKGSFWSIVPLLEFFDLPEEERVGKSCYPLLPYFMQGAYEFMQSPKAKKSVLVRWVEGITRIRFPIPGTRGEVEIERKEPGVSKEE